VDRRSSHGIDMSDTVEYSFRSEALDWIRYNKSTQRLEVRFCNGSMYSYGGVPESRIQELVNAPSLGRYFHQHIAHSYRYTREQDLTPPATPLSEVKPPPLRIHPVFAEIKENSLANIRGHIPDNCVEAISELLDVHPTLVRVVRCRKTKHGDHRLSRCGRYNIVTVNASGNAYQILITLLHELAHAKTFAKYGRSVAPHGAEWKRAFSELLLDFLGRELFPAELAPHVRRHAANPRYSTYSDSGLRFNLRAHDTVDIRLTVAEIPTGQKFSLDGKLILAKRNDGVGNYFNCVSSDGQFFRVHAMTRVHSVFESQETTSS
jgi:SprT protein